MADRTRSRRRNALVATFVAAVVALTVPPIGSIAFAASAPQANPTVPTVPLDENEYYPQERSITDCTGFVERPGCGSDARGGTAQTVLFAVLMGALTFIGWRVFRGVRRRPS